MQNYYNYRNKRKYNLKVHIVLVTKHRKALLQNGIDDFAKCTINYLAETGRNISSGQTDTSPVVLEKYHQQSLKSI